MQSMIENIYIFSFVTSIIGKSIYIYKLLVEAGENRGIEKSKSHNLAKKCGRKYLV